MKRTIQGNHKFKLKPNGVGRDKETDEEDCTEWVRDGSERNMTKAKRILCNSGNEHNKRRQWQRCKGLIKNEALLLPLLLSLPIVGVIELYIRLI